MERWVTVAEHYQVTTTTASRSEADRLAALAVETRLAACGQVSGPVTSTYRWEGEIRTADEWVCTFKTSSVALQPLLAALRAAHDYDTPELVATPIVTGDADYLAWIDAETKPPPERSPARPGNAPPAP